MQRREFLYSLGALALAGCESPSLTPPGRWMGASASLGHRLLDGGFPQPTETRRTRVLIVGGGIAGLAAGWWLHRAGMQDFQVLELEEQPGGNSRAGHDGVTAYPLAAHYLPLPPPEARYVRLLLAELGVLQGDPDAMLPTYDEAYLCAAPQERLYRQGWWEEGLLPRVGISREERAQQVRFQARMEALKQAKGRDGRKVFALPMDLSSRDPQWLALDRLTFKAWLIQEGFDAPSLHWLANYGCRDDYGTPWDQTSAWAGLHYFASRTGGAKDVGSDIVLTTPGGNAWLAQGLARAFHHRIQTGWLAYGLTPTGRQVEVLAYVPEAHQSVRYVVDRVIWAAPAHGLLRVWPGAPKGFRDWASGLEYAPWLVANLSISTLPAHRGGAPLAWDNVLYDSPGLGYVVATHQSLRYGPGPSVLTYYRALDQGSPAENRQALLSRSREAWAEAVLADLAGPHPDLRSLTTRIDIARFGHAMARPRTGSLWGDLRPQSNRLGPVVLAHADLSGFSIFEEAQYRGVLAAQAVLSG